MEPNTIGKLFNWKNRVFEIPSYQRAYSWGKTQINQFIEDLQNADSHYYLGHFLFEKKENNDNVLLIIDGQQRLTTCIIFFSCVKKELQQRKNNGETVSLDLDAITNKYLRDMMGNGTQKLRTVTYDNNFFVEEIIDAKDNHTQVQDTKSQNGIAQSILGFVGQ